jgi:hypothetical protein
MASNARRSPLIRGTRRRGATEVKGNVTVEDAQKLKANHHRPAAISEVRLLVDYTAWKAPRFARKRLMKRRVLAWRRS